MLKLRYPLELYVMKAGRIYHAEANEEYVLSVQIPSEYDAWANHLL